MGMRDIAGGLTNRLREAMCAAGRATFHLDRQTLAMLADLALAHLGAPGTLSCSAYLASRWRRPIVTQGIPDRVMRSQPGSSPSTSAKGTGGDVNA
jgi:hypothetical protein